MWIKVVNEIFSYTFPQVNGSKGDLKIYIEVILSILNQN